MSRWRKWSEFGTCDHCSTVHTHRSIMPLSWQRRWVTVQGCSFPARTRHQRLAHRPTELAHFCSTSLCPHHHLDVFFFLRRFVFSLSCLCENPPLSTTPPLRQAGVNGRRGDGDSHAVYGKVMDSILLHANKGQKSSLVFLFGVLLCLCGAWDSSRFFN